MLSQILGAHYSQNKRTGNWQKCPCTTYSNRGRGSKSGGTHKANLQKFKRDIYVAVLGSNGVSGSGVCPERS